MKKMIDLSGKEAIVTGGGSGIGRGICAVLTRAGANVLVTDISIDSAKETINYCEASNNIRAETIDVTDIESINFGHKSSSPMLRNSERAFISAFSAVTFDSALARLSLAICLFVNALLLISLAFNAFFLAANTF